MLIIFTKQLFELIRQYTIKLWEIGYKSVSQVPWETEKHSEIDVGFIWVKPESGLIYRCHLFDICSTKFPALPNLVRKEEYLPEKIQAIFHG